MWAFRALRRRCRAALGFALGGALLLVAGGCATVTPAVDGQLSYFAPPAPDDAWSRKIRGWQQRELQPASPAPVGTQPPRLDPKEHGSLRDNYNAFLAERKRQAAREPATWVQEQSRDHYIPDAPVDHWATFEATL